jgi:integrin beta 3
VDRAGDLYLSYSDGSTFKAGHVVGADADPAKIYETIKAEVAKLPPPKDGADGLGFEDLSVGFDGERTITFKFARGDKVQEFSISPPWPLFRGIWREGKYQAGDTATHEGSTWAALADTDSRPGTPNSQWQLTNKRGRDGREGKAGPPGSAGKDGRDGRDLTQLGPDGRKW